MPFRRSALLYSLLVLSVVNDPATQAQQTAATSPARPPTPAVAPPVQAPNTAQPSAATGPLEPGGADALAGKPSAIEVVLELSPSRSASAPNERQTFEISAVAVQLPSNGTEAGPPARWSVLDPERAKAWGPVLVALLAILLNSFASLWQLILTQKQVGTQQAELDLARDSARALEEHQAAVMIQERTASESKLALERSTSAETLALERAKADALQDNLDEEMKRERSRQELAEIATKLNTFYGPFKQLRAESQLLYRYFARREKEEAQSRGEDFRTLTWVAEGKPLVEADQQLLYAILGVGDSLLKLIENQAGVVDKPALQDLLGKYAAHIRLLRLAAEQKLTALGGVLGDIVYPRAIDGAIESAVLRLQDKQRELTSGPAGPAKSAESPTVPETVAYYDKFADAYASATLPLDLRQLYDAFLRPDAKSGFPGLSAGSRILDAGCGPGRDTRAFIERGYRVVSVDASKGMVEKCREYPHAYCVQIDLLELQFREEFDGVWACAVLLHMTEDKAREAARRLITALRPGGCLFISVKKGVGSNTDADKRFFQYYTEDSVRALLASDSRVARNPKLWESKGVKESGQAEIWINAIFQRAV